MDKKGKIQFTNEKMASKFTSLFELVNYAIKLAENMIHTGRDARVKSDVQNKAMLILEEISEGKDQFDELRTTTTTTFVEGMADSALQQPILHEERLEKRKYRTAEILEVNE